MTGRILDLVALGLAADPRVPLLIRGEPGVGKDTVARLIHAASPRRPYSFIKVNCAVQPADRCEADLFGHEKGVSPLAIRRRLGSFEFANDGTIYLDEIGGLPRGLVSRLVHVLRTGEISHTGSREIIRVNARVIASIPENAETAGTDDLRQALQRLNVVEISVPPLRQRPEDIPLFATFFLEQFNRQYGRNVQLRDDVVAAWKTHVWLGNLHDLKETIHRVVADGAMYPVK